jgi:NADH-quinone oxidoreductase subunit F
MDHLELLDELSRYIRDCSLCGLGQTAPNPVLTTMRHFRQEFEDHIVSHRCIAGVCTELALSPCENSCPLHMNIPRFLQLYKERRTARGSVRIHHHGQPAALLNRAGLPASLR